MKKTKLLFVALALVIVSMLVVAPTSVGAETCSVGSVKAEWDDTLKEYFYECTNGAVTVSGTNRQICWEATTGYDISEIEIKYDGLYAHPIVTNNGCWTTPSYDISYALFYTGPTLVEILYFEGALVNGYPQLTWETGSELDLVGFNIYRAFKTTSTYVKVNSTLIPPQTPGSVMGNVYVWNDTSVYKPGNYYYVLEQVDLAGLTATYGPVSIYLEPTRRPGPGPGQTI